MAHVEDEGLLGRAEGVPVEVRLAVLGVAGRDHQRLGAVAMSEGDHRRGGASCSGGDAGHDLEGHASLDQRLDLLAAATEDQRIAAFEPHHPLAQLGASHEKRVDLRLAHEVAVALLAGIDALGPRSRQRQDALADETVMDHDVGPLEQAQRLDRQELGIARTGAHEMNDAHGRHCRATAVRRKAISTHCWTAPSVSPVQPPKRWPSAAATMVPAMAATMQQATAVANGRNATEKAAAMPMPIRTRSRSGRPAPAARPEVRALG